MWSDFCFNSFIMVTVLKRLQEARAEIRNQFKYWPRVLALGLEEGG